MAQRSRVFLVHKALSFILNTFNKGKGRQKVANEIHKVIFLESPKFSDLIMQRCVTVATVIEN